MVEEVIQRAQTIALRFALLMLLCRVASAHRLDELLQATIVIIESNEVRLQITLTPGVAVADNVIAGVDRNRDGVVDATETSTFAEGLQRDIRAELDGRILELRRESCVIPRLEELRTGWGLIQAEFTAGAARLSAGSHELSLQNRHLPEISAYMLNAAPGKPGTLEIVRQTRNDNQSVGSIDFTYTPPIRPYSPWRVTLFVVAASLAGMAFMAARHRSSRIVTPS